MILFHPLQLYKLTKPRDLWSKTDRAGRLREDTSGIWEGSGEGGHHIGGETFQFTQVTRTQTTSLSPLGHFL